MVTLVAGAVAVGLVSVCAIPFGCFISRKMKKNVSIPPEVARGPESEEEESSLRFEGRVPNPGSGLNTVEVVDEPQCLFEEILSGPGSGRVPRVVIRVLVSNGSAKSDEVPSQGCIAASGTSESSSSRRGASAEPVEVGRFSSRDFATGPATEGRNQAGGSSPTTAARMRESSNRGSERSDTTRLDITISGSFSKSVAQFGEFKNQVQESSTPKSVSSSTEGRESGESDTERSRSWSRGSFDCNGASKTSETSRDVEVINLEVTIGDDLRQRRKFQPSTATGAEKVRKSGGNEDRELGVEGAVSSRKNGTACDRGRWGLAGRFFETFRETTSFATF